MKSRYRIEGGDGGVADDDTRGMDQQISNVGWWGCGSKSLGKCSIDGL